MAQFSFFVELYAIVELYAVMMNKKADKERAMICKSS